MQKEERLLASQLLLPLDEFTAAAFLDVWVLLRVLMWVVVDDSEVAMGAATRIGSSQALKKTVRSALTFLIMVDRNDSLPPITNND